MQSIVKVWSSRKGAIVVQKRSYNSAVYCKKMNRTSSFIAAKLRNCFTIIGPRPASPFLLEFSIDHLESTTTTITTMSGAVPTRKVTYATNWKQLFIAPDCAHFPTDFVAHASFLKSIAVGGRPVSMAPKRFSVAPVQELSASAREPSSRKGNVKFPGMANLRWRVDVTISTSSLNRALKPTILMEMVLTDGLIPPPPPKNNSHQTQLHLSRSMFFLTAAAQDMCIHMFAECKCITLQPLTNSSFQTFFFGIQHSKCAGSIKTFELSVEQFHELRFNVAKVLKDMEDLEKNPILKIK